MQVKEEWKDVPGYEGLYQASSLGRLKSFVLAPRYKNKIPIIMQPSHRSRGYLGTSFTKNGKKKTISVARVIAKAFIPNTKNKSQVNHKNGIKTDNRITNLEWVTSKENVRHSYKLGLKVPLSGEKHPLCRHSNKTIEKIRYLARKGFHYRTLALMYNMTDSYCCAIIKKRTRKDNTI